MALVYSSMTAWPLKWFELYHKVLKMKGVHYTFTEGRKTVPAQQRENLLVQPLYKGYTVRFFYFACKKEGETFVGIEFEENSIWRGRIIVHDGVVKTQSGKHDPIDVSEQVKVGDIYTLAFRTDDVKYCKFYINDREVANIHLSKIRDQDNYELWESSDNHSILSMHFYNESAEPTPHLGDRLYLNQLRLPVGAYGTYAVAYTGTTEAVKLSAKQHPSDLDFTFENNGRLKTGDIFYCIVRITAYGLDVSVSFDPDHKFEPAVGTEIWLRCCFDYGSIQNAHIVSPW